LALRAVMDATPACSRGLARVQVFILDDWGLTPLTAEQRDLLEIIDDRHGRASTIVTSQLPIDNWHAHIADSTLSWCLSL
jgi:DNA replication protein DnaC